MIELDGSTGEGGGQILRSALTLSMITGQAFTIRQIRANRPKPGLMRQHLVAVQAAAAISGAAVDGAELRSEALTFSPRAIVAGDYEFAIGSAGSCTLVLQTLLPALLTATSPSTVRVSGGTHNPMAPPAQFLQRAWSPILRKMGAQVDIDILRCGFYPAGGGILMAKVAPWTDRRRLLLVERGARTGGYAESIIAGVAPHVAARELECIGAGMGWSGDELLRTCTLHPDQGPGNIVFVTLEYEKVTEVFAAHGEKMLRADAVARSLLKEVRRYTASQAAVGEHLADQLMLPMALAGGGAFTAVTISQHARTNAAVIERFLPVSFGFEERPGATLCTVGAAV
jgi:RNA 3'-terminal phosphate cyclase (ATP)